MKNNNIYKYIFIIFIILLIIGTIYILYTQNISGQEIKEDENSVSQNSIKILDTLTMGISNYDTMNPILTNIKEIINIDKIIFEPLFNITSVL